MKKPAKHQWDPVLIEQLLLDALTSDYTPTLALPEHERMADAFDARMVGLSLKRAWRGSKPRVQP